MRYYLENDILKVEMDSFGAEIKSIIRKDNNREYLWYGNPKVWGRTSPVLFPIVGTCRNNEYKYNNTTYHLESHGFARDNEHTMVEQTEDEIWFELRETPETLKKFPFNFILRIGYKLVNDTVKVMWKVENTSEDKMYFQIGAHPAFLCPVHGEKNKKGYTLCFDTNSNIKHHGNKKGVAVHEDLTLELTNGKVEITEDFFDRSTFMIEDKQASMVAIEDPSGTRFVEVRFDAPLFAIWSPENKNAPFFCIEPWFGRSDYDDFEGDISEREFIQCLEKNDIFDAGYEMSFFRV